MREALLPLAVAFFGRSRVELLRLVDKRVNEIGLATFFKLGMQELSGFLVLGSDTNFGDDFSTLFGPLVDRRDIEIAINGERQCPGDGCRGHHKDVRGSSFLNQARPLCDTELVLLVDNDKAKVRHQIALMQQGVGSDEELGSCLAKQGRGLDFFAAASQQRDLDSEGRQPLAGILIMLLSQNLSGRHESSLGTAFDGLQNSEKSNDGLTATDIAMKKTVHRSGGAHVMTDLVEASLLGGCELKWQCGLQLQSEFALAIMDLASRMKRAPASIHNTQLIGVKLLKGKVAPGLIQLGLFLGKMQGTQSPAGRPSGKLTLRRRCRKKILGKLIREVLQRTPDRGAHRFLRHASSQPINRRDSAGMNAGGFFVALLENFILGMVNRESALEIFDAPINKKLHALNNGAIHERHVPPAQGQ